MSVVVYIVLTVAIFALLGLVLAIRLALFLFAALLFPERF